MNQNQDDMKMTVTQIYNEHHSTVYNYVLSVLKNVHDAEEVANNVFIKIHRLPCAEYDSKHGAEVATWVRLIAYQQILDHLRTFGKKGGHYTAVSDFADSNDENKSYFDFVAPKTDSADQEVLDSELHSRVAKAFRTLKPKYRKIAIMFYLREMEYTEIANVLDIPMGSVKGMLSRARAKLQTELDGVYRFKSVNVQSVEA